MTNEMKAYLDTIEPVDISALLERIAQIKAEAKAAAEKEAQEIIEANNDKP